MGANAYIYLPTYIQIKDVASLLGAFAGLKPVKRFFHDDKAEGWYTLVPGVKAVAGYAAKKADIVWEDGNLLKPTGDASYYFESENRRRGDKTLYVTSTSWWIAAGVRLLDLFGGELIPNDCDPEKGRIKKPWKSMKIVCPKNGADWYALQEKILTAPAITMEEILPYENLAAYQKCWENK